MDVQKQLNAVFSSDDNYARHMGAAMLSLLGHSGDFEKVVIYVIENGISDENRAGLEKVAGGFENASIEWVSFGKWKEKLTLDLEWPIALSAYARLFVGSMLPTYVGRVIYFDCDMIICDSVRGLWETDLGDCLIGAVQDFVNDGTKGAVGLAPEERYYNSGLLLIDLDKWREAGIEDECVRFIAEHGGKVTHHDQGVINGVLAGRTLTLPVRYNLMTIHYIFDRDKLVRYYGDHAGFYPEEEVEEAKKMPAVLHFTPSFTCRPWVKGCAHPLRKKYRDALDRTPWKGTAEEKDRSKWYVKLINLRYRVLPY